MTDKAKVLEAAKRARDRCQEEYDNPAHDYVDRLAALSWLTVKIGWDVFIQELEDE